MAGGLKIPEERRINLAPAVPRSCPLVVIFAVQVVLRLRRGEESRTDLHLAWRLAFLRPRICNCKAGQERFTLDGKATPFLRYEVAHL